MNARSDLVPCSGRRPPRATGTVSGRGGAGRRACCLLALAAALTLLLPAVLPQAAAAGTSSPLPALLGTHMVNGNVGWAVTHTQLLRTANGGRVWYDLTPAGTSGAPIEDEATTDYASTGGRPANLAVVGSAAAWLVVPATSGLTVYASTDAGAHWSGAALALDTGGNEPGILGVHFVDSHHGWLAVTLGGGAAGSMDEELYASIDGGATWHLASGSLTTGPGAGHIPLGGIKTGFGFAGTRHGWLTGASHALGVWLYTSGNAGRTWHTARLSAPGGTALARMLHAYPTTLPPTFIGGRQGFLPVFGSTGTSLLTDFFVTFNGGTTWRPTAAIVTRSTWPLVWGWPDTRHGFESDGKKLDTTANGGHTWRVMALPKKIRPIRQIDFGTRSIGWAIVYGKLWKTRNGGHAWTKLAASLVSP